MKFQILNFGCRTSQAEAAAIAAALRQLGHEPTDQTSQADLVILNTCTVTAEADRDVRQAARRIHRQNPAARMVVAGCYAQRAPEEAAALPGVCWVVGNTHKFQIPEIVSAQPEPSGTRIFAGDILAVKEFVPLPAVEAGEDRTRPILKIQDGCSYHCTFCVVPSVRGRSRSAPPRLVVEQVRALSARYKEIVLSGVNLGRWGREPGIGMRLADLLRLLLAETDVARIRLSSIEPLDLKDDLLELIASSGRIARHLHVPLQSGSDRILKLMRRWYRVRHYAERIRRARELLPEAAIGADVMVGFPGETEEDFELTRRLVEELPFTYLHVFTFSPRPGTPAAEMPDQVPKALKKRRNEILRGLAAAKNLAFRRAMIGKRLSAVTIEDGWLALSDNYLRIELAERREPNQIVEVEVGDLCDRGVKERVTTPVLEPGPPRCLQDPRSLPIAAPDSP